MTQERYSMFILIYFKKIFMEYGKNEEKLQNQKKLQEIVFENLRRLPAYKVSNRNKEIFKKYVLAEWNKAIQKNTTQESDVSIEKQYISDIYRKPNQLKIFFFSFRSLPKMYKHLGLVAVIFCLLAYFFVRSESIVLALLGALFFLVCAISLLICGIQFGIWYSYTESTFSILDRLLDEIKNYIGDFKSINSNKNDMHTKAYLIIENFIRNEISGLDYD